MPYFCILLGWWLRFCAQAWQQFWRHQMEEGLTSELFAYGCRNNTFSWLHSRLSTSDVAELVWISRSNRQDLPILAAWMSYWMSDLATGRQKYRPFTSAENLKFKAWLTYRLAFSYGTPSRVYYYHSLTLPRAAIWQVLGHNFHTHCLFLCLPSMASIYVCIFWANSLASFLLSLSHVPWGSRCVMSTK